MKIGSVVEYKTKKKMYMNYSGIVERIETWGLERKDNGSIEPVIMVCVKHGNSYPWYEQNQLQEVAL